MAGSGGSGIAVPEPILTCVQCQEEYQESQNAEGYCKYHPSPLESGYGHNYLYVVFCVSSYFSFKIFYG